MNCDKERCIKGKVHDMHDLALDFSADRSSVLLHLSEEHVNLLDDVKSSYDIRNQRWERFCKAVTNTLFCRFHDSRSSICLSVD